MQEALARLSRGSRADARRGRVAARPAVAAPRPPSVAAPEPPPEGALPAGPALPFELGDLMERLDRITDRLSELQPPARALPATREIFSEWVRLRRWEEMSFADFLNLRRAGRV
jgi:hypothetical protein